MQLTNLKEWIIRKLSILKWIPAYNKDKFKGDLTAGLTVGIMIIPQSMAYAVLAGVPPIYGLYASVVPLLIYPLFATTRHIFFGVVAVDMIIVSSGVGLLAEPGSATYIMLIIVLTAMVGIIQLAMSIARLGFIVNLLSKPVITGFTMAAPVVISLSQLDHLLGLSVEHRTHIFGMLTGFYHQIGSIHFIPALLGCGSIILLLVLKKYCPSFPKVLAVVLITSVAVWGLNLQYSGVDIVGVVPKGLSRFKIPTFTLEQLRALLPTAITLALVQFMHITSVSRTLETGGEKTIRPNNELFAIGAGNLAGGFFQGLPVSGSFSRSAVGEQAGSKTPLANVFSAVAVAAALLFLTPLLYFIPMPAFAAIIIVAALGLFNIKEIKYLFKTKERDGYIALFTFATMLLIGIQEGILLGIAASLVSVLIRNSRPNIVELGQIDDSPTFRNMSRYPDAQRIRGLLLIRIDASFSFNNAEYFKKYIIEKIGDSDRGITDVIIDGRSINDLDTTALDALEVIVESLEELGVDFYFAGLKGPVHDVMLRSGLAREIGGARFHLTMDKAVRYILERAHNEDASDHRLDSYEDRTQ